jgi:hypothetical protein
MPIEVTCSCGRALNLRDELAGKLVRCPACAGPVEVPVAVQQVEVVEEVAAGPPPLPGAGKSSVAAGPPPLSKKNDDDIGAAPPVLTPDRKESKKKKKKDKKKKSVFSQYYGEGKAAPIVAFDEGWFGSMNGGIIGGIITLLGGILLLILLLSCGGWFAFRGMILAIILIVVGIGAILKGLLDLYQ